LLPFDEASARRYGYLRAALEKDGQTTGDLDLHITLLVWWQGSFSFG
jgi:predicted nucleic acid-binding protein